MIYIKNLIYFILGMVLGMVVMWFLMSKAGKVSATIILPSCGTETYFFYNEGFNSRVWVNVHDSDEEIDVTGQNGWAITGLWLDQEGGSTNYISYGSGNRHDFNPSNFGDIDKVKVEVSKACPTPTPTPVPASHTECVADKQDEVSAPACVKVEGDGESTCTTNEDCLPETTPTPTPEITPTPTVTPGVSIQESKPEGCTHDCGVPACTDAIPEAVVNPHVYRNGDCAIVKWYPKQGDKVNLYWKQNSSDGWQYSLANSPNDGSEEICALGSMDITFGVQSVNGCAADGILNASPISQIVDGNTSHWQLFR